MTKLFVTVPALVLLVFSAIVVDAQAQQQPQAGETLPPDMAGEDKAGTIGELPGPPGEPEGGQAAEETRVGPSAEPTAGKVLLPDMAGEGKAGTVGELPGPPDEPEESGGQTSQ